MSLSIPLRPSMAGDAVFEENNGPNRCQCNSPTLVVDADSAIKGTVHLYHHVSTTMFLPPCFYRHVDLDIDPAADVGEIIEHD
ncbi:MAG: hypothetical protein QF715_17220 [Pseudomonadales bacterium]|nr:hypothetical protein [Pseudomonadales bacterium]